ncbi:MAG TPA: hypothetical protein VFW95_10670 [Candidatus Limnocylindria bacterium]|nr:hypothetical protein [Candidatus Limnocylindria bacterium]
MDDERSLAVLRDITEGFDAHDLDRMVVAPPSRTVRAPDAG